MGFIFDPPVKKDKSCFTHVFNAKTMSIGVLLLYLLMGVLFYRYYDGMSWAQAYYFAVSQGLRVGCDVPAQDVERFAKIVTIIYKVLGIAILALLYTLLFRSNFFQTIEVRRNRINGILGILLVLFLLGTVWSYNAVGWTGINSMYFVFSAYWW